MGMFDDLNFDYRMPDGFKARGFQSKDLDCLGDTYEITSDGRLVRMNVSGIVDADYKRPVGDMNYSGMLNIYCSEWKRFGPGIWHEYDLEFVAGRLAVIHCHQTESQLIFEPGTVGRESDSEVATVKAVSDKMQANMDRNVAERKSRKLHF